MPLGMQGRYQSACDHLHQHMKQHVKLTERDDPSWPEPIDSFGLCTLHEDMSPVTRWGADNHLFWNCPHNQNSVISWSKVRYSLHIDLICYLIHFNCYMFPQIYSAKWILVSQMLSFSFFYLTSNPRRGLQINNFLILTFIMWGVFSFFPPSTITQNNIFF